MISNASIKKYERNREEVLSDMKDYVISGRCSDYNEYKLMVGKIQGLNIDLDLLNSAIASSEEDEDD